MAPAPMNKSFLPMWSFLPMPWWNADAVDWVRVWIMTYRSVLLSDEADAARHHARAGYLAGDEAGGGERVRGLYLAQVPFEPPARRHLHAPRVPRDEGLGQDFTERCPVQ